MTRMNLANPIGVGKLTELTDDEYDSFLEKTHSMLGHNSKNR